MRINFKEVVICLLMFMNVSCLSPGDDSPCGAVNYFVDKDINGVVVDEHESIPIEGCSFYVDGFKESNSDHCDDFLYEVVHATDSVGFFSETLKEGANYQLRFIKTGYSDYILNLSETETWNIPDTIRMKKL